MRTVLSIAGSDCSGGAGIQADIKTLLANGVYAMTAITALTAQNTCGVTAISPVTPEFLAAQLDAVFTDIFPHSVKIGMLPSPDMMEVTAQRLLQYEAQNIVIDPVMVATSGSRLMQAEAVHALTKRLFPLAAVITPNIPEAQTLTALPIRGEQDMERAAKALHESWGCSVLLKGGHSVSDANDLLFTSAGGQWFRGSRIANPNTHGTGCTLSSAIAANLAKGYDLPAAVSRAKDYISGALAASLDLGKGSGPLNHGFDLNSPFAKAVN